MPSIRKMKCLHARFGAIEAGSVQWKKDARGYLLLESSAKGCAVSFVETAGIVRKAAHIAGESMDMVPDAAKILGRVGTMAVKAALRIESPGATGIAAQGIQRDWHCLKRNYAKHSAENYNLKSLEKERFRCILNACSVAELFPGKNSGSSAVMLRSYINASPQDGYVYPVAHFTLEKPGAAGELVSLIRAYVPAIQVMRHELG